MRVEEFIRCISAMGINTIVGVPDSTLKIFCDYINTEENHSFSHYVAANEGAAAGIAVGTYLGTTRPACVYMQNSGLGNFVNPFTSLMQEKVYKIPALLIVGWRGEPKKQDEPQHKFMGEVTIPMLNVLGIKHAVVDKDTDISSLKSIFDEADKVLSEERAYCIVVKKGTFENEIFGTYHNSYTLIREEVIAELLKKTEKKDILISTTGKISRELYEQSDLLKGQHAQEFLTVGGMGHASMIAFGIACKAVDKKVICIDGDGAVLMHMGNLAFIGQQKPQNLIHICLNNQAHESVGGMPTGAINQNYYMVARECGYIMSICIENMEQLREFLEEFQSLEGPVFVEIRVALQSREALGRPKETAEENKIKFMKYHEVI